jgi:hypothetical protein
VTRDVALSAYANGNPFVYAPSSQVPNDDSFVINFLWINRVRKSTRRTDQMVPDLNEFVNLLQGWRTRIPHARLCYWYDSVTTSTGAVSKARERLAEEKMQLVDLLDIRTIPLVQEYPKLFDMRKPVYFRVDFLKAVIPDYWLHNGYNIVIMSDIDVHPMSKAHLFDMITMENLVNRGFTMSGCLEVDNENQFTMFYNTRKNNVRQRHREFMVDYYTNLKKHRDDWRGMDQVVFHRYWRFISSLHRGAHPLPRPLKGTKNHGKPILTVQSKFAIPGALSEAEVKFYKQYIDVDMDVDMNNDMDVDMNNDMDVDMDNDMNVDMDNDVVLPLPNVEESDEESNEESDEESDEDGFN